MIRYGEQKGSSLLEVMVALVIFALAAAGLTIALPFAYQRVPTWQEQFNLGRYLEKQLEIVRSYAFDELALTNTGFVTEGDYEYRRITGYVIDDQLNDTWADSATGSGDGLAVTYYDNVDFTGTTVEGIDTTVNFDWGLGSPDLNIQPDGFSARWVGYLEPEFTETYTFYVNADDGVRLWVNNQLLIDQWVVGTGEWNGTIDLTVNVRYSIKLEYFESIENAKIILSWSSLSVLKSVVPESRLYSSTAKMTVITGRTLDAAMSLDGRIITFEY